MVMLPSYVQCCADESGLSKAIQSMLDIVLVNIESGYDLNVEALIGCVEDGMTLGTFNMLVMNLNRDLGEQFRARSSARDMLFTTRGISITRH